MGDGMKKINLWDTYHEIENLLSALSDYTACSPYQKMMDKLKDKIKDLYEYSGIRKLKMDVGSLKAGETVQVLQDECGVWLTSEHDTMADLYDYEDISPEDMFY